MTQINYQLLLEASLPGGPSALGISSHLLPAGGPSALISPAKYTDSRNNATYVIGDRFIDGIFRKAVLIDARTSVANRIEEAITRAAQDGHPVLERMPYIQVTYRNDNELVLLRDSELPHRAFDAHIRLGSVNGAPVTANPRYRAARDSHPDAAGGLFELSPVSTVFGCWDSTRKRNQARFPAAFVGEIIGVVSDSHGTEAKQLTRSGARIDPVGARIQLDAGVAVELAERQGELSEKTLAKIRKQKGQVSASNLGLGAIPPGTSSQSLDGIATSDIIRSYALSFAVLRRLRFGRGQEGDASIRALLAAIVLSGIARNDAELFLRANCHLVEKDLPVPVLNGRGGEIQEFDQLTVEQTDVLLEESLAQAERSAELDWHGQVFEVVGDPAVLAGARSDELDVEGD